MCAVHLLQDGASALHLAASYGHAAVVQLLLQKGADPNVSNMHHRTPCLYTWIDRHEKFLCHHTSDMTPSSVNCLIEGE